MGRLKCGHNDTWTMRLVDKGVRYAFCVGCLIENAGVKDIFGREIPVTKPVSTSTLEKKTKTKVETEKVKDLKKENTE